MDRERLLSQAGFLAEGRWSFTDLCMYERSMVEKHMLSRIHCPATRVKEKCMQRWKDNDWDEKNDRDDKKFLELEKGGLDRNVSR